MASGGGKTKIKYAKLRLFKPSSSGRTSEPETQHVEGQNPKTLLSETIEKMEQKVICLSDSEDAEPSKQDTNEPLFKKSRPNENDMLQSPKLPKFPKKPPQTGGIISKFFKTSEDDFEPEVKKDAPPKTKAQRKTTNRKPRARQKSKNQSDIRKVFQKYKDSDEELLKNLMLEHTLTDRLDPEQFQVALAMSRSLVDQGGAQTEPNEPLDPQQGEPEASSSENILTSEERRIQKIRTTLEQYGFKCKNSYTDYDLNVIFGNVPKNVKKIKHQRPTMLIRRGAEDVVGFMERQANRLLKDELYKPDAVCGEIDLNQRSHGSMVFWMSQNPSRSTEILSDYYVETLVDVNMAGAGSLLKDWSMIPGRERTPERKPLITLDIDQKKETSAFVEQCEEGDELLEDPEDSKLDMNTVSDEYRRTYNNEAPIYVRTTDKNESEEIPRSSSPELFASDSCEEDGDGEAVKPGYEKVDVQETPSEHCEEETRFLTPPEKIVQNEIRDTELTESLVRTTSSENIFEDSDPMINYEVYSSEEAKMSSSLPGEKKPSDQLQSECQYFSIVTDPQTIVLSLSSSEGDNENCHQNSPKAFKRTCSDATDNGINQKERRFDNQPFPSPSKEFSFHALAIKDKLNRVSQTDVETIELDDDCDERLIAKAEPDESQSVNRDDRPSSDAADDESDNVLVISDDEVNYSIHQDFAVAYNKSRLSVSPVVFENNLVEDPESLENPIDSGKNETDLENTKVYFDVEDFRRLSSEANVPNEVSDDNPPNVSLQADNTMAFLDGIVKKYNLTPTLCKQSTCDEANEIGLDDYIQHYEIPDFPDNQLDQSERTDVQFLSKEKSIPMSSEQLDLEIAQILSQAKQTCTQFQKGGARGTPIRRTTSDSVLIGNGVKKSTVISPKATRKDCFEDKFKELVQEPAHLAVGIEVRLKGISPRPDYEGMESPLLHRELFKYGLKQLSRPKAVKILNHIYNQLHPMVDIGEIEESDQKEKQGSNVSALSDLKNFVPEMEEEQYILPSKPRKKTFWCAVPLHIAFHNMVSGNPCLRRQMLLYQPLDLDEIYNHLKEIGLRYESNDLIAFLDKRCITFRTSQGSGSRTKKTTCSQDAHRAAVNL